MDMEVMSEKERLFLKENEHAAVLCPHCNKKLLQRSTDEDLRRCALYCTKCKKDIPFHQKFDDYLEGWYDCNRAWTKKILEMFGLEDMLTELEM